MQSLRIEIQFAKTFGLLILVALITVGCRSRTLTILGEDSSNLAAIEDVKADFEREQGIKIKIERVSFEDALEKANQDLSLGTGKYDVILEYNFTLASYVEGTFVWRLDELKKSYPSVPTDFESELFQNVWREVGWYYDAASSSGSIAPFGYPFAANTLLLVYDRKAFEDPGNKAAFRNRTGADLSVPKTWNDFARVAQFFTNTQRKQYGVALQGAAGGWLYYELATILNGMGGRLLPKKYGWEKLPDVPVNLADAPIVAASRYYLSLKPFNAGDFTKTDAVVQTTLLKEGKAVMGLVWSDYVRSLAYDGQIASNRFGFAPVPGDSSPIAGGSFYINRHSKNPDIAFRFLSWLLNSKRQERLVQSGLASPVQSAFSAKVLSEVPYATALLDSIKRGSYAFEANRDSELIQVALTTAIQNAWNHPSDLELELRSKTRDLNAKRPQVLKH